MGVIVGALALLFTSIVARRQQASEIVSRYSGLLAAVVVAAWGVLFLWALERGATPYPANHLVALMEYAGRWAKEMKPAGPVALAAIPFIALRAARGRQDDQVLAGLLALWLPVVLFAGNRDLQVRQISVLSYLAVIAGGRLIILAIKELAGASVRATGSRRTLLEGASAVLVAATVVGAAASLTWGIGDSRSSDYRTSIGNWNNQLVRQTATWIQGHIRPGAPVMSSSLYHAQLYFLTDGRDPVYQLPTLGLSLEDRGGVFAFHAVTTWTRYEDHRMEKLRGDEQWLFLTDAFRRYAGGGVYIGLSQDDLIDSILKHNIEYAVLTGEGGQSSLTYVKYFESNPAFTRVYAAGVTPEFAIHIFHVDSEKLRPIPWPVTMSGRTLTALIDDAQASRGEGVAKLLDFLAPNGLSLNPSTPRERRALADLLSTATTE